MKLNGPGKYDEVATVVREATGAEGVLVAVLGGVRGTGFSVQALSLDILERLPKMLRDIADQIERGGGEGG